MKKPKLPKSIEIHDGQSLDSIIEYARELGEKDFSKIVIDIEVFEGYKSYSDYSYPECEVKLKRVK